MRTATRTALFTLTLGALASLAAACKRDAPPPAYPANSYAVTSPPPAVGSPLPQGWVWPPTAGLLATLSALPGVVRPVDAAALRSTQPSGCRPLEVAPGFFVMAPCAPLPQMFSAMGVRRQRSSVPLPPQVDLRATGQDGPVKDQQQVGVCWSFAISTLMDNAIRRAAKTDVVAPLHVLASDAWSALFKNGKSDRAMTLEQTWPYDPVKACKLNESPTEVWCESAYHVKAGSWKQDPLLTGEVERANATGAYRITKMETLNNPKDPEEYAEILASGRAIYGAFYIDDVEWSRAKNGIILDYPSGTRGGHAVAVVGYRIGRGRELLLHNSWGPKWGEGGYAWISEAMVRQHGKDAFVIEVDAGPAMPFPGGIPGLPGVPTSLPGGLQIPGLGGSVPLPFPLPGVPQNQPPSGGGCQVRDMVFGTCANPCPSGSPPVAGICAPSTPANVPAAQQCGQGQVLDWASQQCVAQCQNGLPPIGGHCF